MRHSMSYQEFTEFLYWFKGLPFKHKILVPGNHDVWCEQLENNISLCNEVIPKEVTLLINQSVEIDGVKFWGSPYTPWYFDWGFQLHQHEAEALWPTVPEDTNVLITHGPAKGVLDDPLNRVKKQRKLRIHEAANINQSVGCPFLAQRVQELPLLKAHLFGHIHESYGRSQQNGYIALNSAVVNEEYKVKNKPQLIEV